MSGLNIAQKKKDADRFDDDMQRFREERQREAARRYEEDRRRQQQMREESSRDPYSRMERGPDGKLYWKYGRPYVAGQTALDTFRAMDHIPGPHRRLISPGIGLADTITGHPPPGSGGVAPRGRRLRSESEWRRDEAAWRQQEEARRRAEIDNSRRWAEMKAAKREGRPERSPSELARYHKEREEKLRERKKLTESQRTYDYVLMRREREEAQRQGRAERPIEELRRLKEERGVTRRFNTEDRRRTYQRDRRSVNRSTDQATKESLKALREERRRREEMDE